MTKTTLFTFGYYGWGNHTPQLVEAVDAVERSRGFEPPLFVDIRIRRTVRAKGFQGNAFEKLLGQDRHRWMKSLGNKFIVTRTGPHIQIAEPGAADELLDLAIELARRKQRLLFFCSCQWPRENGQIHCHRATVAELVLAAAKRRGDKVEIVEWPGGEQRQIDMGVAPQLFKAIRSGRMTIPLGDQPDLAELAGLPWCSIATLKAKDETLHRVVGPAISQTTGWALPVFPVSGATAMSEFENEAEMLRRAMGLNAVQA